MTGFFFLVLGCCHVSKTSNTASQLGCDYATNAGFFSTKLQTMGCCVGSLIVNSSVVQVKSKLFTIDIVLYQY